MGRLTQGKGWCQNPAIGPGPNPQSRMLSFALLISAAQSQADPYRYALPRGKELDFPCPVLCHSKSQLQAGYGVGLSVCLFQFGVRIAFLGHNSIQISSTNIPVPRGHVWHPAVWGSHRDLFQVRVYFFLHLRAALPLP